MQLLFARSLFGPRRHVDIVVDGATGCWFFLFFLYLVNFYMGLCISAAAVANFTCLFQKWHASNLEAFSQNFFNLFELIFKKKQQQQQFDVTNDSNTCPKLALTMTTLVQQSRGVEQEDRTRLQTGG